MSVFSQVVNAHGVTTFPATPQVVIPFQAKSIAVVLEDDTDDAFVSFDGENDHGHLVPGTPAAGIMYEQNVTKVWVRAPAGTDPVNVQIIVEG